MPDLRIELMQPHEAGDVIALIRANYDKNVAGYNSDEGNKIFYDYLNINDIIARNNDDHFMLLAKDNGILKGVIEVRNYTHISLFFVRDDMRGQGIGKKLFGAAKEKIMETVETRKITVNSSPNSTNIYRKLGFMSLTKEKSHNGLRYVPMSFDLVKK